MGNQPVAEAIEKSDIPSVILTDVVEKLSVANTLPAITAIVAQAARKLTGADGATFVLREGNQCYYADENAISPLWKGSRFPLEACISGWAMLNKESVIIPDIYKDSRIPHDAYRPTFVKSLCMMPIRAQNPIGAIGNYWANGYCPTPEEVKLLQVLANSSAIALENLELKQEVQKKRFEGRHLIKRQKELETAIHSLAHDLKNPLTAMMGFTELVQMRLQGMGDARLNSYCESILATGMQAHQQIQKMLSLYQVTHQPLRRKKISLSKLCEVITERHKEQEPHRDITVIIEPKLVVHADLHLMTIAMENLISNAFKYSSKKPSTVIHIGQEQKGPTSTFFIKDNGDGFESAQARKLFHPLVRLHSEHDFPGTGLGLASVARIIELHGGKIYAEGQKSEGATFYFTLT
jgi:K+-sensing histidine kinase KdpD